ncbi:hypothetical protein BKA61DRAFT_589739, partial [Leptodontidium sp. MPI-SDFR-AT-0119]
MEVLDSQPLNSIFVLSTTQRISWSTTIQNFDFFLYQQLICDDNNCVNGPFLIAQNLTNETNTWNWQVTTGTLTLKPTNTFFLIIRDVNDELNQFGSSYLNFTSAIPLPGGRGSSKQSSTSTTKLSPVTESSSATLSLTSITTVRPKSSAFSTSVTSSATSIASATTIPTPTSAIPTILPTALPISSPSGDLSTGAKVGMIIGAISAVVIAIFLGWYLGRRRKNKSTKSPFHPFETPTPAPPVQLSELHVPGRGEQKPIPPPFTPRELHGKGKFDSFTGVQELDAWDKPSELGDGRRAVIKSGVPELGPIYT